MKLSDSYCCRVRSILLENCREEMSMLRSMLLIVLLALCLSIAPAITHAQEVTNLVLNPSFEDEDDIVDNVWAEDGWLFWGQGDGLASVIEMDEDEFIDGTRSLRVDPKGAVNWHFQAIYYLIEMDVGDPYTYSFWAKAAEEREMRVMLKDVVTTGNFGGTVFNLTTEWAEYTATTNAMFPRVKLEFHTSGTEVSVWLDFVYVYKGEFVEGILPSKLGKPEAVEPADKLPIKWAELKVGS